jgi:hypothetical protein
MRLYSIIPDYKDYAGLYSIMPDYKKLHRIIQYYAEL